MVKNKLLVLIVDDSQVIINKIRELLLDCKSIGRIISASSFNTAIELIDSEKPDVALLDINLPQKSGIDILMHIKDNNLPVKSIMVSNQVSGNHRDLCKKIGADHFIDKSIDFETLNDLISSFE